MAFANCRQRTQHHSQASGLLNGSQWVSQLVSDKHSQWSESGPIKMNRRFSLSLKMHNESETEMERAYKSTDKIFDQRTYIVHTMNLRG